jgi:hypothetical protein
MSFFEKTGSAASPDIDLLFLGTGRFVGNPETIPPTDDLNLAS